MTSLDYWVECLFNSLEENGVKLPDDKIAAIAVDLESAHENYGMAFYQPTESPYKSEAEKLRRELKQEREKVYCFECRGSGRIVTQGPYHSGNTQCWKCKGEGRHAP